ncbi:ATP-binding cassette domain-containing protein [Salegentibacter salarius]|uniref:ABC transporter ATP-binding protein n=1 Tax=Salegentibacter salarius TaxID=435906 RepID=A0A2N0U2M1_9FLAO|nr:ATP-binding cassette domain-containing protein [Salegentibacter salarius]OEY73793.1 ABC transporter ATP-binding protein [Salegentibacter salarius]PKD21253.1 ABC transporter ATP-binding protein [Salegentibacter salarius]SLJ93738.1 ABC-type branched-chain amino acid transport system, ATPase component [Salegentibacter salarius]
MIFEIDNVELYFAEKQILNGVYLKAETGKITGILGANGSGKSSLLNIFFGSLQPRHKLIRIDKKPYLKPLFKYGMVTYLPQQNFIPPKMKLETCFQLFKVDVNGFLQDFPEFRSYRKARMREFSGGQRRIIEIYICLNSRAELILLDEPFSHLSPLYIEKIKSLIQELKKEKAIILTDHMYRHILDTSDELYLLKNGSTKLIDKTSELEDYNYLKAGTLY